MWLKQLLTFSELELIETAFSILSPVPLGELRSTSYTLTSLLFRHGAIRIDFSLGTNSGYSGREESLDWVRST